MKVNIDGDKLIVFLNKMYVKDIKLEEREDLEDHFKHIFRILKEKYNINISGYYQIEVFIDKLYGIILNIEKEDIDYYDYFSNQVDMKIIFSKYNDFLYLLDEYEVINKDLLNKCIIYKYKNKIYLKPKPNIDYITIGRLLETSSIIYGQKSEKIFKNAQIIDNKCFT